MLRLSEKTKRGQSLLHAQSSPRRRVFSVSGQDFTAWPTRWTSLQWTSQRRFGAWVGAWDAAKFGHIEGAEVGVLEAANASDLATCGQLTVEFHDKRPPLTQRDIDRVCERMRSEGYGMVNANWPYFNDILFVNLKSMSAVKRIEFRCRMNWLMRCSSCVELFSGAVIHKTSVR